MSRLFSIALVITAPYGTSHINVVVVVIVAVATSVTPPRMKYAGASILVSANMLTASEKLYTKNW